MTVEIALRRLFRVVNGGTPTSDPSNWDGEVAWATPVDLAICDGSILSRTQRTLTVEGLRSGSTEVPPGSLLVSTRAPIGYVAQTSRPSAFNQGCRALVPRVDLDIRYYRYVLTALKERLVAAGQGSTFVELSLEGLASTQVPLLSVAKQRAIADYLDTETARIDALISKKESLLTRLEERARARADTLLLGGGSRESPLSGWRWVPARRLCSKITVGVVVDPSSYFVDEGVPFIHGTDIRRGWINETAFKFLSRENNALLQKSQVRAGDVLTMRVGEPGRSSTVPPHLDGANCASVLIFRRSNAVGSEILCAFLNGRGGRSQIEALQYGAAQGVLNVSDALALVVPVPPQDLQRDIVGELRRNEEARVRAERLLSAQVGLLRERRQALILASVSGAFEVSGVA